MQCALYRPNFWGAFRSAANCLVRAVATLCRLEITNQLIRPKLCKATLLPNLKALYLQRGYQVDLKS